MPSNISRTICMCIMVWLNTVLGTLRKPLPIWWSSLGGPRRLLRHKSSHKRVPPYLPLSFLEKHFIAPPSYKTTSKYSKILRVHAVMGLQRQLIKRRSRGDVERAAGGPRTSSATGFVQCTFSGFVEFIEPTACCTFSCSSGLAAMHYEWRRKTQRCSCSDYDNDSIWLTRGS